MIPNIQKKIANKKLTTESLDNDEKETVFDILNKVGSYDINHTEGLNSNRVKNALCNLTKTIPKKLNSLLRSIKTLKDSHEKISGNELEGQGIRKIIKKSKKVDFYSRLEILEGLKLPVNTNAHTEAINLIG